MDYLYGQFEQGMASFFSYQIIQKTVYFLNHILEVKHVNFN